jgi:hypothetical protein
LTLLFVISSLTVSTFISACKTVLGIGYTAERLLLVGGLYCDVSLQF